MLMDEIRAAWIGRLESRWLKDSGGGRFMKIMPTSELPEAVVTQCLGASRREEPPKHLIVQAESLKDDCAFLPLPVAFPEDFLDGECVVHPALIEELEALLATSVDNALKQSDYWVARIMEALPRLRAAIAADPRFGGVPIPGGAIAFAYGGVIELTLAGFIALMDSGIPKERCPECGRGLILFHSACGLGSGSRTGHCLSCGRARSVHGDSGPSLRLFAFMKELTREHPEAFSRPRYRHIGAVLRRLEE